MEPGQEDGQVGSLHMDPAPDQILRDVQAKRGRGVARDHEAREKHDYDVGEQGEIEEAVYRVSGAGAGEHTPRGRADPAPGQQQMNQRSTRENECEPFMGDESGQANYEENTDSDQQTGVQRESETGARDHATDQ